MPTSPKERFIKWICGECGGDNVSWDASVSWDVVTQCEVAGDAYDKSNYCSDCEAERPVSDTDLDEGEILRVHVARANTPIAKLRVYLQSLIEPGAELEHRTTEIQALLDTLPKFGG